MTKAEQDLEEAKKRVEKYCADNIEFWSKTMQYAAEANLDTSGALAGVHSVLFVVFGVNTCCLQIWI